MMVSDSAKMIVSYDDSAKLSFSLDNNTGTSNNNNSSDCGQSADNNNGSNNHNVT